MAVVYAGQQVNGIDPGSMDVGLVLHFAAAPHPGDPLLRRSFQAGGQPARAQVGGRSGCPWVTAGDRSFPPVLARVWHGCANPRRDASSRLRRQFMLNGPQAGLHRVQTVEDLIQQLALPAGPFRLGTLITQQRSSGEVATYLSPPHVGPQGRWLLKLSQAVREYGINMNRDKSGDNRQAKLEVLSQFTKASYPPGAQCSNPQVFEIGK